MRYGVSTQDDALIRTEGFYMAQGLRSARRSSRSWLPRRGLPRIAPGAVGARIVNPPCKRSLSPPATSVAFVALGIGKSVVIDFPHDIKDVLVGNPKIANAVVRSSRRAYVIGVEIGQTNVYFFDTEGKQMVGLDIAVTRSLNGIRAAIKQVLPEFRGPR